MTKEDLEKYKEYNDMFIESCIIVADILSECSADDYKGIGCAENFSVEGDKVCWEGEVNWRYGGHDYYSGNFPIEYLTMPQEEFKAIIEEKQNKYIEALNRKLKEDKERQEKIEYEQYIKLKEKYGD